MIISLNKRNDEYKIDRGLRFVIIASVLFAFISKYGIFSFRYSVLLYLLIICLVPVVRVLSSLTAAIELRINRLSYFIFAALLLIDAFIGVSNTKDAVFFAVNKILLFFLFCFLASQYDWYELFAKVAEFFSKVLIISVLVELFAPSIIASINSIIMTATDYSTYLRLYSQGYHLGFSIQASYLAFNIAILVALKLGTVFTGKAKFKDYLWLVLGIIVIILSGKRAEFAGIILSVAIICIILVVGKKMSLERKIGIIALSAVFAGVIIYIMMYTTLGALLFEKGMNFSYDTTRTYLIEQGLLLWNNNPFWGNGTNYFSQNFELSAHNTYLQLLCENGILGLLFFVIFAFSNLIVAVRSIAADEMDNENSQYIMSSLVFQIFFLFSAYFESMFSNEVMWIVYIIFAAMAHSIYLKDR